MIYRLQDNSRSLHTNNNALLNIVLELFQSNDNGMEITFHKKFLKIVTYYRFNVSKYLSNANKKKYISVAIGFKIEINIYI